MSEDYVVLHKRSSQVVNGFPKLPEAEDMLPGELAINYAKDNETISIKNSDNEIAAFSSDNVINKVFHTISKALDDLDEKIEEVAVDADVDKEYFDEQISIINSSLNELRQTIIDNEEVVAAALNDLKSKLNN